MSEIITVAIKETKSLLRDPASLVMLFLLPAIFILIMSVALQGAFASEETGERLDLLLVDESDGVWAAELSKAIEDSRRFRVVRELDGESLSRRRAEREIRHGRYRMGVVIPSGIEEAVELEGVRTVQVIVDPALSRAYAVSVESIVEGVASARIISELVDQTHELARQAEKAAKGADEAKRGAEEARAAADELKTKIEELAEAQRECVDTLQETAKTAKMLDEKLRSVKTKLKAAGFNTESLQRGGTKAPPGQSSDKKSTEKQNDKQPADQAAESDNQVGDQEELSQRPAQIAQDVGAADADADADGASGDADPSETDGDVSEQARGDHTEDGDDQRGVRVEQRYVAISGDGPTPNTVQQQVPGWTIFALFWIVQILAVNMIRERLSGAFRRILVSPLALWKYLVGATIPFFVINLLQACVMFAIGIFILPVLGCERLVITDVPALLLVTVCVSLAALSLGLLMASISQTVFFAASASAILIVIMAVMGGIMVPRVIMPATMQQMGYWVPHGWAFDGYVDVLVRGDTASGVLDTAYALLGFAAAFFAIAMLRFRRMVRV